MGTPRLPVFRRVPSKLDRAPLPSYSLIKPYFGLGITIPIGNNLGLRKYRLLQIDDLGRIIVTVKLIIINKAQPRFSHIFNDNTNQSCPIFLYEIQFLAALVD